MIKSIGAADCMAANPVVVKESTDLFEAIHLLLANKVTGLTVVDDNQQVIGVLSELDCLQAILDGSYYGDVGGTVGQFMTREVQALDNIDNMDILEVAKLMIAGKRRRFPVIRNGKFIGQVTCRSVLQRVKDFVGTHNPKENSQVE